MSDDSVFYLSQGIVEAEGVGDPRFLLAARLYTISEPSARAAGNSDDPFPKIRDEAVRAAVSIVLRLGGRQTGRSLLLASRVTRGRDGKPSSNLSRDCDLDPPLAIMLISPTVKDLGVRPTCKRNKSLEFGSALCPISLKRKTCDKVYSLRCAVKRWQKRKKADRECKFRQAS